MNYNCYKEMFQNPKLWDNMPVNEFEKMCYLMNSNPYEEWNKKLMRDEDYIETMMKNHGFQPDTRLPGMFTPKQFHKFVSWAKSGLRIIGCGFGVFLYFDIAFLFFGFAEILGIIEEIYE